jgi:hypothetical protein
MYCRECGRGFNDPSNFCRHIEACNQKKRIAWKCPYCDNIYTQKHDFIQKHALYRHPEFVAELLKYKDLIKPAVQTYTSERPAADTHRDKLDAYTSEKPAVVNHREKPAAYTSERPGADTHRKNPAAVTNSKEKPAAKTYTRYKSAVNTSEKPAADN